MSFAKFNLNDQLLSNVLDIGYKKPTVIQEKIIPLVREKKDIIAFAQTGTGKTAAFSLPIIQELITNKEKNFSFRSDGPHALILLPTRELALQVWENIRSYSKNLNLHSVVCYGGVKIGDQIKEIKKGCDILIATPGRLIDLLNQKHVSLSHVSFFVLDEADHILDIGFMPDVKKIISHLSEHQTLLFSATMADSIKKVIPFFTNNPNFIYANPVNSVIDVVDQSVFMVEKKYKLAALIQIIRRNSNKTILIFAETKIEADNLGFLLNQFNIKSGVIHSDKKQFNRQYVLKKFKENELKVLISTDIAARGLDINNLGIVINFNIPKNSESYVHRIGRTGRAGKNGVSISFCSEDDRPLLENIESLIKAKIKRIKHVNFDDLNSINNELDKLNGNFIFNKSRWFSQKNGRNKFLYASHNNKLTDSKKFKKNSNGRIRKKERNIGFALHNYVKPKTKSETPHIFKNQKEDNW